VPTVLNFRPLGDHVIVEETAEEDVTIWGVLIPEMAQAKSMQGKVVAVGPGQVNKWGVRIPMSVAVGDRVLFAKYAGTEIRVLGARALILREADILAIIEPDETAEG